MSTSSEAVDSAWVSWGADGRRTRLRFFPLLASCSSSMSRRSFTVALRTSRRMTSSEGFRAHDFLALARIVFACLPFSLGREE